MSSISLRPRRRATATAEIRIGATSQLNLPAVDDSPDSDEVRQSAAVLEMMASKSQSRPTGDDDDNIALSELIASVIQKDQQSQPLDVAYIPQQDGWSLEQLSKASKPDLVANFTEPSYDESLNKFFFKCCLLPNECSYTSSSTGKEDSSRRRIEQHLSDHVDTLVAKNLSGQSSQETTPVVFYPRIYVQHAFQEASPPAKSKGKSSKVSPEMTSPLPTTKKTIKRRSSMYDDDPPFSSSGRKKKRAAAAPKEVVKPAGRGGKRSSLANSQQGETPLRRSRRRAQVSVEVTVTTSDDEDEAETAADFFGRQGSVDTDGFDNSMGMALGPAHPAPRFYEMTPQLLESLMAPVGLYQSPSEDGTEKELRLRMPVDFGGGCVGVCDILFNENLGVRMDGATDWMPVQFVGDYLDPESVQIPDTVFIANERMTRASTKQSRRSDRSGASLRASVSTAQSHESVGCDEDINRIAAVLDMNAWMQKVIHNLSPSNWLTEHDYAEPIMKFGRPRTSNILQDAVSAFNKYVNFIRLSERREPFLFGLWWEKEDMHADYWLLPKPREGDAEYDRRHTLLVIPIANEWTEEVVVSTEETIDFGGANGTVTPMTFWDNRGFLSLSARDGDDPFNSTAGDDGYFKKPMDGASTSKSGHRRRTTATPVTRAPRFLAPKLDPSTTVLIDSSMNENGMPDNLDEIVNSIQQSQLYSGDGMVGARNSKHAMTATGSQLKNVSKEKLDEIDFAMRCIKELQQRRISGPCRLHCRICSREFTAPTSLIVHYRSHAGIKPFTCPICLTSFTRRHSLKYHMLCHSGQARFQCNMCDRLFRHSGHYRDHMRKHEHGMPFNCPECNRVFATRTTYRRHMSVVHNSANREKGKGRSVGVSRFDAEMEAFDDLEAGEIGEVAEEIEYEGEDDDEIDDFGEEIIEG